MNHNDPKDVIDTMIKACNDAFDIMVLVENETIMVRAVAAHMSDLEIRWTYKGFGSERVRQISKEYSAVLMARQREQGGRL